MFENQFEMIFLVNWQFSFVGNQSSTAKCELQSNYHGDGIPSGLESKIWLTDKETQQNSKVRNSQRLFLHKTPARILIICLHVYILKVCFSFGRHCSGNERKYFPKVTTELNHGFYLFQILDSWCKHLCMTVENTIPLLVHWMRKTAQNSQILD